MLLAGLRRHHAVASAAKTIPAQWRDFRSSGFRDARAPRAFGVICGFHAGQLEYMTALEVESFDHLEPAVGRMRVPAQRYAVFFHAGHISEAGELWQRLSSEWLPRSGFEDAETPAFEVYDQRFDPVSGQGGFEVWFPVRSRPS